MNSTPSTIKGTSPHPIQKVAVGVESETVVSLLQSRIVCFLLTPPNNAELDGAGNKKKKKKKRVTLAPRLVEGRRAYRLSPLRLVVVSGGVHDVVVFGLPGDAPDRGPDHSPGRVGGDGNPSSSALQAVPRGRVTSTFR